MKKQDYSLYCTCGWGHGVFIFTLRRIENLKIVFDCTLEVWMGCVEFQACIKEDRSFFIVGEKDDFPFWKEVQADLDEYSAEWERCEWG